MPDTPGRGASRTPAGERSRRSGTICRASGRPRKKRHQFSRNSIDRISWGAPSREQAAFRERQGQAGLQPAAEGVDFCWPPWMLPVSCASFRSFSWWWGDDTGTLMGSGSTSNVNIDKTALCCRQPEGGTDLLGPARSSCCPRPLTAVPCASPPGTRHLRERRREGRGSNPGSSLYQMCDLSRGPSSESQFPHPCSDD